MLSSVVCMVAGLCVGFWVVLIWAFGLWSWVLKIDGGVGGDLGFEKGVGSPLRSLMELKPLCISRTYLPVAGRKGISHKNLLDHYLHSLHR